MKTKDQILLEEAYENLLQSSSEKSSSDDLFKALDIAIPENTSYEDLASAIARIIREDYGSHNIEPFLKALQSKLNH
jgi:hypothetical protein